MKLPAIACIVLISIASSQSVRGYDKETHREVSREAFSRSVAPGYGPGGDLEGTRTAWGIDQTKRQSAVDWVADGAQDEDDYITGRILRFNNHFFNPLDGSGLHHACASGSPSPDWGLENGQDYSFKAARQYFFEALTDSNRTDREHAWAKTFYTLGHVIHLIEDMAQPQHTRNDIHGPWPCGGLSLFETYTEDTVNKHTGAVPLDGYAAVYGYDAVYGAEDTATFTTGRSFWTLGGKGLADYSNRGFVSAGTNFLQTVDAPVLPGIDAIVPDPRFLKPDNAGAHIERHAIQDLPGMDGTTLQGDIDFIATPVNDEYRPVDPPEVNHMTSTYSIFDPDLQHCNKVATYITDSGLEYETSAIFTLNRFNFRAAWPFLIPRAVGYSAGLLNYFFRGAFSVSYEGEYGNGGHYMVRNDTAEPMHGTLRIYYDDAEGNRQQVGADQTITLGPAGRPGSTQPFQFIAAGSDTCLNWAYQAVFRGQLGLEADAVIPAGAFSPAVPGPTVEVAGDLSSGTATATLGSLTSYQWYGACYHYNGDMCPIWLAGPTSGGLSGGGANLQAPLWEGWWFPCDYCCLYLRVTDSCGRGGFDGACFAIP